MNFNITATTNKAKIFSWNIPASKIFHIDFSFYFNGKTLPSQYDQTAHLLEHVFGSQTLPLQKEGAFVNARTTQNKVSFYCDTVASDADKVIDLYLDTLFANQVINDVIIDHEKKTIRAELSRSLLQSKKRLNNLLHSHVQNSFLGSDHAIESLKYIDTSVLNKLKNELFQPSNMVIYIAGNISKIIPQLKAKIESITPVKCKNEILVPLKVADISSLPDTLSDTATTDNDRQMQFSYISVFKQYPSPKDFASFDILKKYLRESSVSSSFFNNFRAQGLAYDMFTGTSNTAIPEHCVYQIFGVAREGAIESIIELFYESLSNLLKSPTLIRESLQQYKRSLHVNRLLEQQTARQIAEHGAFLYERNGYVIEKINNVDDVSVDDIKDSITTITDSIKNLVVKTHYK